MNLSSSFLIFVFIVSTPFSSFSAAQTQIPLGSKLSASNPNSIWSSPNSTFTFTFISQSQLYPSSSSSSSAAFYAAILYDNNIPIWVASDVAGLPSPTDFAATLSLSDNGNLIIRNGSTSGVVWQSNTPLNSVKFAAFEDSGNFILNNSTNSTVWSTFDHPTDTLVPSQNLNANQKLRSGLYSFGLLKNGNLTLLWNDSIVYYNSGFNSSVNASLTLTPFAELKH